MQIHDLVARKGDLSGRTRHVLDIQKDADGAQHITLDEFLDGWLIWNANELIVISTNANAKTHFQSSRPSKRAHGRER